MILLLFCMFYEIRFFSKNKQWKKLLFTQFLLAVYVLCSGRVTALAIKDYCLSEMEPSKIKTELENSSLIKPNEIWLTTNNKFHFSRNNRKYSMEKNYDTIQLSEANKGIISQIKLPLEKDSWIRTAYLTKSNWLYVSANKNNYAVEINLDNPETYLKYSILPKIYPERCSDFRNWFEGGCYVKGFSYHSSSNKVFLSGYMATSDGQKWVVMEIAGGQTKILNTSQQIKSISHIPELNGFILQSVKGEILFYDDDVRRIKTPRYIDRLLRYIPKFNGVLLQGIKGEVLFYDGTDVIEIASTFPRQSKRMRDWYLAEITAFEGEEQNYSDERIFLTNFREGAKTPHLFMELKEDLSLKAIPFPDKRNGTEITLVQFPNDSLLWAILSGKSILVEQEDKFENVVTVPRFHYLALDNELTIPIKFEIGEIFGKKRQIFYLKKVSNSAQCDILLEPKKPLLLKPE